MLQLFKTFLIAGNNTTNNNLSNESLFLQNQNNSKIISAEDFIDSGYNFSSLAKENNTEANQQDSQPANNQDQTGNILENVCIAVIGFLVTFIVCKKPDDAPAHETLYQRSR